MMETAFALAVKGVLGVMNTSAAVLTFMLRPEDGCVVFTKRVGGGAGRVTLHIHEERREFVPVDFEDLYDEPEPSHSN